MRDLPVETSPSCPPLADRGCICRGMIGDWQDEWDLKRRGSDQSVNRHDISRRAAYLNFSSSGHAGARRSTRR